MDRAETEKAILKHMEQIRDIHKQYAPNENYLALFVSAEGKITFSNTYWELPTEQQINFHEE